MASNGGTECGHSAAIWVSSYKGLPIYWCPGCQRHVLEGDIVKVKTRGL